MNVSELINILRKFPPDALIVTEGYETGYEPVKRIQLIKVETNTRKEWWDGKYEISDKTDAIEVVFLNAETKADRK